MKRARTSLARHRQAGFSLIEMVAAFLVFAIGMGVLMQVLATSMHSTRTSGDYTMAALWAESKLDAGANAESLAGFRAPRDVVEACIEGGFEDLSDLRARIAAIRDARGTPAFARLATAFAPPAPAAK